MKADKSVGLTISKTISLYNI